MARRPKTDDSERRTSKVTVQLTPTERAEMESRAVSAGVHLSDYTRAALFSYRLYMKDPLREKAVSDLWAVGNNLNQLAKHANTTGQLTQHEEIQEALKLWRDVMNRLFD